MPECWLCTLQGYHQCGTRCRNGPRAKPFGVHVPEGAHVNFGETMERMRTLRAQISPADSAKRFSELGIDVFFGAGQFVDDNTISVTRKDGSKSELKFKKAVIASGARASAVPIPGLDSVKYLTNENLFSLTELPRRFGIIGSGPVGAEMAQTFARFGSEVFLFERNEHILPREDAAAAAVVQKQFLRDGVNLILGSQDQKIASADNNQIRITGNQNGQAYDISVDQLLVAVGRAPNTEGLNLEEVNVKYDRNGVEVNDNLQTTNKRIYAAGDICSKYKFTHAADFQARIVIQNALFAVGPFGKKKASDLVIPWATFFSHRKREIVRSMGRGCQQKNFAAEKYLSPFFCRKCYCRKSVEKIAKSEPNVKLTCG